MTEQETKEAELEEMGLEEMESKEKESEETESEEIEYEQMKSKKADSKKVNSKEATPKKTESKEAKSEETKSEEEKSHIFAIRTTANREDQVMDFISSNIEKKKLAVYSVIRPHGMRGYIFIEAESRVDAEQAAYGVPYARGVLQHTIQFKEIEHMLEKGKKEYNIQKNDIAEIISGPFKREKCKITRVDKTKNEVVVELLEAAVPIPITVNIDSVKVIRREGEEGELED